MDINIDNYVSEEKKKEIAEDVFREYVQSQAKDQFERVISNSSYGIMFQMIDDAIDDNLADLIKSKVVDCIIDMSEFSVFRQPDRFSKRTGADNRGWELMSKALDENIDLINERVKTLIGKYDGLHYLLEDRNFNIEFKARE